MQLSLSSLTSRMERWEDRAEAAGEEFPGRLSLLTATAREFLEREDLVHLLKNLQLTCPLAHPYLSPTLTVSSHYSNISEYLFFRPI